MFDSKNNPLNGQAIAFGIVSGFLMAGNASMAITIEVFSRYKFGSRYLTVGRMLSGLAGLWMVNLFANMLGLLNSFSGGFAGMFLGSVGYKEQFTLFNNVMPLYIFFCIAHLIHMQVMKWKGVVWHSRSFGVPWLEKAREIPFVRDTKALNWLFSDFQLYRFVEPALFFVAGQLIGAILHDTLTSSWLIGASIGLFLRNKAVAEQQKERLQNMLDAQIENRFMADALAGKQKNLTAGFSQLPLHKNEHDFVFNTPTTQTQQPITAPAGIAATVNETMNRTPDEVV